MNSNTSKLVHYVSLAIVTIVTEKLWQQTRLQTNRRHCLNSQSPTHFWSQITKLLAFVKWTVSFVNTQILESCISSIIFFNRTKKNSLDRHFRGVIIPTTHEPGEFLSSIFLTPKPDGTLRMIPNLKKLKSNSPGKWSKVGNENF